MGGARPSGVSGLRPPRGGMAPPVEAPYGGAMLELRPLAQEICRRYRAEFADEEERYGDAGVAWCVHDNQHILGWACASVAAADNTLSEQVAWLARVLAARSFPLDRLTRDLEIAADIVREQVGDGEPLAAALLAARVAVAASSA